MKELSKEQLADILGKLVEQLERLVQLKIEGYNITGLIFDEKLGQYCATDPELKQLHDRGIKAMDFLEE